MKTTSTAVSGSNLARGFEVIAIVVMAFAALAVVAVIGGTNGFSWSTSGPFDNNIMAVRADVNFPVDFGDRLAWTDDTSGTVDAATGLAPVELGGPVRADLAFWGPTNAERAVWVLWQISGPLLVLAGTWQVYNLTKSTRRGDPFTRVNERRLWTLAVIAAVGGSAYAWIGEAIRNWLIQRSAAAELFSITAELSFVPLAIGLGIAVLAAVWHEGVALRDDVEGMV